MSKIGTLRNLWFQNKQQIPVAAYNNLVHTGITNLLSDKAFLKLTYRIHFGEKLDLDNPLTFNEKLQWLKLYNRKPEYRRMVDKQAAKQYVASIIGDEYIIPTLGVWDKFEDIDFNLLPNQFVLKCTHDSGSVVICKDKRTFDYKKAKARINRGLKNDLFWFGREWPYKGLKRQIIAEKYMKDAGTSELRDYKFFCFNGVAKCYKVDFDRFIGHKANYFTPNGELMKIGEQVCPPDFSKELPTPANLETMKKLATKLSETHPFLRADFYDVDGKVYFGELTFYPASGFGKFIFKGNDELLGSWIKLPEDIGGGYYLIYKELICVLNCKSILGGKSPHSEVLNDYKFFCFNGEVKCLYVSDSIHHKIQFYDDEFHTLDIERYDYTKFETLPKKPVTFEKMKKLAQQLSKGMPHIRVDFYEIKGQIYFGELTFYTGSGFIPFKDRKWDELLGSWIQLPIETEDKKTTESTKI